MNPNNFPPPEYANKPNLWRVACEIMRRKNPDLVRNGLLAVAGSVLKEAGYDEQ